MDQSAEEGARATSTDGQPQPATLSPQELINLQWADWLARRYPGTRWQIVGTDGGEGDTKTAPEEA